MSRAPFTFGENPPELLACIPLPSPCTFRLHIQNFEPNGFNRIGTEHRLRVAGLEGVVPSSSSHAAASGAHFSSKIVEILPACNCPEVPLLHIF